jgi:glycosyltransferase involved in cell wall biosynthesis
MRIIYITVTLPFGSREAFLLAEIEELLAEGNSIKIVPMNPSETVTHGNALPLVQHAARENFISPAIIGSALRMVLRHPLRTLAAAASLFQSRSLKILAKNLAVFPKALWVAKVAEDFGAEHIHAQWAGCSSTLALVASRVTSIPWSFTAHRWDIPENNLLALKIASAAFARGIDDGGVADLRRYAPGYAHRVVLLHVGVKIPTGAPKIDRNGGTFRILVPGLLVPKKGHTYLIDALRVLASRGIDVHADFAGDGPLENEIRAQVILAGLQDKVNLLGLAPHEKLMRGLAQGRWDAVVLPSIAENTYKEGIPVSLTEAMSRNVPVISTETGGIPELLRDGAGLLVPERNSEALADAIESLISDNALYKKIATAGRRRVEESFAVTTTTRELLGLMMSAKANDRSLNRENHQFVGV